MTAAPSWGEMWRTFGRIGLLSFGGPAAQIALMHRELVDDRKWLGEQDYLRALSFCMLLPGPEAMQLATMELQQVLMQDYGFTERGAQLLMGQAAEYEIANVVDPAFTVVAKMRKELLPKR